MYNTMVLMLLWRVPHKGTTNMSKSIKSIATAVATVSLDAIAFGSNGVRSAPIIDAKVTTLVQSLMQHGITKPVLVLTSGTIDGTGLTVKAIDLGTATLAKVTLPAQGRHVVSGTHRAAAIIILSRIASGTALDSKGQPLPSTIVDRATSVLDEGQGLITVREETASESQTRIRDQGIESLVTGYSTRDRVSHILAYIASNGCAPTVATCQAWWTCSTTNARKILLSVTLATRVAKAPILPEAVRIVQSDELAAVGRALEPGASAVDVEVGAALVLPPTGATGKPPTQAARIAVARPALYKLALAGILAGRQIDDIWSWILDGSGPGPVAQDTVPVIIP